MTFIYIIPTVVIIRYHLNKRDKYKIVVVGLCGFLVFTSLLPIMSVPITISDADFQMASNYSTKYTSLDTSGMLPRPFSLWNQFNGIPGVDSQIDVQLDIEYYDNGDDKFYFDYYAPKSRSGNLPAIIKLHGGAWILGNKGPIFNVPLSKYLAAQGYAVFDVQYGIFDIEVAAENCGLSALYDFLTPSIVGSPEIMNNVLPKYNRNYMIQDQVVNIGEFTKFLAANVGTYNADVNNVFLMGSSAGAHMSSVIGCGYNNMKFSGVFSSDITMKGIVLFYAPTDLEKMVDAVIDGRLGGVPIIAPAFEKLIISDSMTAAQAKAEYEKYSAAYLIRESGVEIPPILVLHGSCDNLVPYVEQGVQFYEATKIFNRECIFVTIPFAGHFFDGFNGQGAGWQMSTYYVERFLALEVA